MCSPTGGVGKSSKGSAGMSSGEFICFMNGIKGGGNRSDTTTLIILKNQFEVTGFDTRGGRSKFRKLGVNFYNISGGVFAS